MSEWVVSLHAATYSEVKTVSNFGTKAKLQQLIEIPDGITMYFYTRERAPLSSGIAWPLFYSLMGSAQDIAKARTKAVEVKRGKDMVFDYQMVGDDGWVDRHGTASGIFEAGNRYGAYNWGFNSTDWRRLSWLFQHCAAGDTIHWLCCRAWH